MNLATATLLAEYGSDDVAHFLCECDDAACRRRLELRRDEFETARQAGGRLVSPECVGDAPVLRRGDRFVVIAELEGR